VLSETEAWQQGNYGEKEFLFNAVVFQFRLIRVKLTPSDNLNVAVKTIIKVLWIAGILLATPVCTKWDSFELISFKICSSTSSLHGESLTSDRMEYYLDRFLDFSPAIASKI
jgi:hypothetical protein